MFSVCFVLCILLAGDFFFWPYFTSVSLLEEPIETTAYKLFFYHVSAMQFVCFQCCGHRVRLIYDLFWPEIF
jgi:hypothetical protein